MRQRVSSRGGGTAQAQAAAVGGGTPHLQGAYSSHKGESSERRPLHLSHNGDGAAATARASLGGLATPRPVPEAAGAGWAAAGSQAPPAKGHGTSAAAAFLARAEAIMRGSNLRPESSAGRSSREVAPYAYTSREGGPAASEADGAPGGSYVC